jgi:hypothetical protein
MADFNVETNDGLFPSDGFIPLRGESLCLEVAIELIVTNSVEEKKQAVQGQVTRDSIRNRSPLLYCNFFVIFRQC